MSYPYIVRYFSHQWTGTFWVMERFKTRAQAFSYAKIVCGSVFIKITTKNSNSKLLKIN